MEGFPQSLPVDPRPASPQVDEDRQDRELVAQMEKHEVLPEPLVHAGAEVGLDLHVHQQRSVFPLRRHLGDEIHLPPAAGRPVGEVFLVQEGGFLTPQVRGGFGVGEAEEVGEEEFDEALRELVVAGQVRSPRVGAEAARAT